MQACYPEIQAISATVARLVGKSFATMIEANPTMNDGSALFNSAAGNDLAAASLSVASVDTMIDALRTVPTEDGGYANGRPKYFIVSSKNEATSRVLISSLFRALPPEDRMYVLSSPWLSGDYIYLLADPEEQPIFSMAVLKNSAIDAAGDLIRVTPLTPRDRNDFSADGTGLRLLIALGLNAVSRSVVRMELA